MKTKSRCRKRVTIFTFSCFLNSCLSLRADASTSRIESQISRPRLFHRRRSIAYRQVEEPRLATRADAVASRKVSPRVSRAPRQLTASARTPLGVRNGEISGGRSRPWYVVNLGVTVTSQEN